MRVLRMWIAAAAVYAAGCANGNTGLTSPSPLGVAPTPSVPSSCSLPAVPGNLSADVTGTTVGLTWSAVDEAMDYVVLVGSTPTSADTLFTNTLEARHAMESVPAGTHFARVHAHNWCGTSEPSDPVAFTIR